MKISHLTCMFLKMKPFQIDHRPPPPQKKIIMELFYSELKAYSGVLDALRAGGVLTSRKSSFLADLRKILSISEDRHKAEVRRAINSEILNTVCEK